VTVANYAVKEWRSSAPLFHVVCRSHWQAKSRGYVLSIVITPECSTAAHNKMIIFISPELKARKKLHKTNTN